MIIIKNSKYHSKNGVVTIRTDVTKVSTSNWTVDSNISILSPRTSPRILDFPIIMRRILEDTDQQYSMIDASATLIQNSSRIIHKIAISGCYSNRGRSSCDHRSKSVTVSKCSTWITWNFVWAYFVFACACALNIGIEWLSGDSIGDYISQDVFDPSAVAAAVSVAGRTI